jgi:hypothetical protein
VSLEESLHREEAKGFAGREMEKPGLVPVEDESSMELLGGLKLFQKSATLLKTMISLNFRECTRQNARFSVVILQAICEHE